jgi:hypothetical protein
MLLAIDFDEHLVDVESIAITTVLTLQSAGIYCAKFYAPETDRFSGYCNASLGQQVFNISVAEIESIVDPDCVGNDIWWETMTFICVLRPSVSISDN